MADYGRKGITKAAFEFLLLPVHGERAVLRFDLAPLLQRLFHEELDATGQLAAGLIVRQFLEEFVPEIPCLVILVRSLQKLPQTLRGLFEINLCLQPMAATWPHSVCIAPELAAGSMQQDFVLVLDELVEHIADARLLFAEGGAAKRLQDLLLCREA
ncbi:MAG: hypothetical protein ACK56I_10625, partial [bacterium]